MTFPAQEEAPHKKTLNGDWLASLIVDGLITILLTIVRVYWTGILIIGVVVGLIVYFGLSLITFRKPWVI